jgi:glucan phosphoethanolaminetransferase (alkaline phosphatase superfamily)
MTRNIIAMVLAAIIVVFTIFTVLAIWDLWELPKDAILRLLKTFFVILCASAVLLFVFSVVHKKKEKQEE